VLVSLDVETACGVGCETKCEHALDPHRARVTVAGLVCADGTRGTYRSVSELGAALDALGDVELVGHNLKFDLKVLAAQGLDLSAFWAHDTLLAAAVLVEKVSEDYLAWYERERARRNETLPRGYSHRSGSPHSLKVLAPYFVGVEPFWEDPTNHDSDEYVLKDCEYTLALHYVLQDKLAKEGNADFYQKLFNWTADVLLPAERAGIALDLAALEKATAEAERDALDARKRLDYIWQTPINEWRLKKKAELWAQYSDMLQRAVGKAKPGNKDKTRDRYMALYEAAAKKLPPLNLDSPAQLNWLLKDYLGLDIKDFDGEETTGKAVLQRLAGDGREDIATFIKYRKARKLAQAFFPSYREMQVSGVIYTSFNPTGTRTGRLSSSGPNLQQVERGIHHLFVARPGMKLATYDMSAIEPRLIAFYTHDLNLYDIVAKGKDFHNYNTAQFFELDPETPDFKKRYAKEREVGKEVGLALMYGAGTNRLMESAQKRGFVWSPREARYKLDRFKEFYEGVYRFRDETIDPALKEGAITNLFGRPVNIQDPSDIHMQGLNTLVQSAASDLVLNSAHRINRALRERSIAGGVRLLVHDEIVTEVPAEREDECVALITEAMTDYALVTPLGPVLLAVEGKVSTVWTK
jgi:DNA polymerase I-like protein with 3'-5' exonuclease and polymerase domains